MTLIAIKAELVIEKFFSSEFHNLPAKMNFQILWKLIFVKTFCNVWIRITFNWKELQGYITYDLKNVFRPDLDSHYYLYHEKHHFNSIKLIEASPSFYTQSVSTPSKHPHKHSQLRINKWAYNQKPQIYTDCVT